MHSTRSCKWKSLPVACPWSVVKHQKSNQINHKENECNTVRFHYYIYFLTNNVLTFKKVTDCVTSRHNLHSNVSFINSYRCPKYTMLSLHCFDTKYFTWSVIVHGTVPCNMKWMYKCIKYYFEAFSSGILYLECMSCKRL